MHRRAAAYWVRTAGWETVILGSLYAAIFLSALAFLFMIFRAAYLISLYQPHINAAAYAEAHAYILLIEIVLWTVIAKAAVRFKAYTRKIRGSADGVALDFMANAMLLSFAYAILFDVASTFKTLFMRSPYLPFVTTVTTLLPLAIFLVLTGLLFVGTLKLKRLLPDTEIQIRRNRYVVAISLTLFALAVIPFGEYFYHLVQVMLDDDGLHHFTLSPGSLLVVYLLPFAVIWLLGLLSCLNLAQYANRVRGKLYRPMFRNLNAGILAAYISTYLIQIWYISNLPSNRFGFGLVSLFVLILLLVVGYGLMYLGANQLYLLEQ